MKRDFIAQEFGAIIRQHALLKIEHCRSLIIS